MAITLGNGQVVYAAGRGTIHIQSIVKGKTFENIITDALYVPEISKNLFSIGSVTDKGIEAKIVKDELVLYLNGQARAIGKRISNKLYAMDWIVKMSAESNYANTKGQSLEVWHERFGHTSYQTIKELAQSKSVTGFNCINISKDYNDRFCEACVFGKQCRKPFNESTNRAKASAELIHFDICGPMSVDSISGDKIMAVFVDDYSGLIITKPMKAKSDIVQAIEDVLAIASASGHKVSRMRSDNAKEFTSTEVKKVMRSNKIVQEFSTAYCPQQNGRVESQNRTIVEMARSMLAAADLPLTLWAEAARTATHVKNRIPLKRLDGKTPIEAWTGKQPNVSYFRIFASKAYMLIDKQFRTKFEKKSKEMILVGYESGQKAYKLWERGTRKIVTARDVEIIENRPKQTAIIIEPEDTSTQDVLEEQQQQNDQEKDQDSEPVAHRTRSKQMQRTSEEKVLTAEALLAEEIPATYEEAINSPASKQWEAAMIDELQSLAKNDTWDLVKLPSGRKAIQNKWIYRIKYKPNGSVDRYKARLVIKGCSQKSWC